ncbi:ABC transporter substrate-binding protein [Paenibacillus agri]|uniref:ABC transporter substrate-binding protein n=1 Tax=Paenibacillus agri TaxID=2744309 RepID=A0A850ER16_9BACL|nr:ABC transporter substrate-binding protein [Paenibacillus agri]NUU61977.1 ABC transporter substrate-binding protein [Paenibacillus agri]
MFYIKKFQLATVVLLLSVALYGCSNTDPASTAAKETAAQTEATSSAVPEASPETTNSSTENAPRTVKDDLGNNVVIPANPQRIVAPYLEDALLALGVKPVAQWSAGDLLLKYLQPQLQDVPKLDFVSLDPEAVLSFTPDLFIVPFAVRVQDGAYDKYAKVAPTYVFQDATKDWRKTLLTLGDLLNRATQAKEALQAYDSKIADIKSALQNQTAGKSAAIMLISDKSFSLMQENTYSGKVIYDGLGLEVPPGAQGNDWKDISLESLPELKADYIFLMQVDGADPLKNQQLASIYDTSVWKNLEAVKAGHVFSVDRDYWINTGLNANLKVAEDVQNLLNRP